MATSLVEVALGIPFTHRVVLALPSYPFGSCHQVGPFSTEGRPSKIADATFGPFPSVDLVQEPPQSTSGFITSSPFVANFGSFTVWVEAH